MKKIVVLLIILALSAVSGLNMAAGQQGTSITAISLDTISLLAAPRADAEVVVELPANTTVNVLKTDESGAWLEVETADGTGYAPAEDFLVLDPAPLAPKAYVATSRAGATALYAEPNITGEYMTSLPNGTIGIVLGTKDEWAYVQTGLGTGWSIVTDWEMLPAGAQESLVTTARVPEVGIYAEPNITSDLVTTIADGTMLYWLGEPEGEFVQVLLPDGSTGYAIATDFEAVPGATAIAETGRNGTAAVYAEPNFTADILATLDDGTAVSIMESVDDYWYSVYTPSVGMGYVMKNNFSNIFMLATVQVNDAIVRSGPNDNLYPAIATLPAGTKVIVKGVDKDGVWIQVAIPFSQVGFGYNGVEGWMRDYLFVDGQGNTDLDTSLLAVTSDE